MNKNNKIYIIRHCEAVGQSTDSPLTEKGMIQADQLAHFLSDITVDRILSSPFLRALQTIQPFAKSKNIKVQKDIRLSERILSSKFLPDWMEKLEATYLDMDLTYDGGESSNDAKKRIIQVVHEQFDNDNNTVIVSHGGLISLLLNHYDPHFGFEQWKNLSNPDVYVLHKSKDIQFTRIWQD